MFKVTKKSKRSNARIGIIHTPHGVIKTPAFMPIATKGAVKTLAAEELKRLRADVILSNTYHQLLRPGLAVLKKADGLHRFMQWRGPMLTDSGGFQVFSLANIRKILPEGVRFRSHIDGAEFLLTPKKAL
ncbi:MAG: tRNA-guanine transglycosylase, partial [Parcubacteria group bacterium]|nr:tRNA-guanine transglycosylase [Parcubacteria group bacterium]